ncbi:deoxycytidylate deaminase-like [Saccostrea echinata]|uniref:deoxycytidylate deaminase-like n=1 Tax=Saccostrea echinata TaxID=191078 RepID=UPI002A803E4D|nr:deoxycytidylate deaminase-like [Saccostrea echinata]
MPNTRKSEMSDDKKDRRVGQRKRRSTQKDDIISWDEYFMGVAFLSAKRSKYDVRTVGTCIVNSEKRIVTTGYNGFIDPQRKESKRKNDPKFSKNKEEQSLFVCHAEMNAIINRHGTSLKDCIVYVTLFPCNECAKLLAQSRISKVIYYANDKAETPKYKASAKILKFAGIKLQCYKRLKREDRAPMRKKIMLDFEKIAFQRT